MNNSQRPKLVIDVKKESRKGFAYCKLYTTNKRKRIGGHRFVALFGKNNFTNNLGLLLEFFGLKPFVANDFVTVGKELEEAVIKTQTTYYDMFEYTKGDNGNYGDQFKDPDFTGLIDADDKEHMVLLEIKNYFSLKKINWVYDINKKKKIPQIPDAWYLQARLYLYLWNKTYPYNKRLSINLVAHYVDLKHKEKVLNFVNWYLPDPDETFVAAKRAEIWRLNKRNITVFPIYIDDTFDVLVDLAKERADKLLTLHKDDTGEFYRVKVPYTAMTKTILAEIETEGRIDIELNK